MAERDAGARSITPLSPFNVAVTYGNPTAGVVQGTGADWFGPLNPIKPQAPAEVAGRIFDYQTGYNLNTAPRASEPVTFAQLRGLADAYDLLRLVIETRKDQLAAMPWAITVRNDTKAGFKISAKDKTRAEAAEKFFRRPDGFNNWDHFLRLLLEDLFVLDAPTIFMQRNRAGGLLSMRVLDGSTIKRVIDDWGGTPLPPVPAYQQQLKGLPAVDYTVRDIMYRPRNPRVNKVYGYSPVEQVMMTVNIALRRQVYQLQYYTEGNIPEALIGVPESWTPEQILTYQVAWDALMEGNTANRRHAKFVPGGVAKTYIPIKEPEQKSEFDEWLARVVCFSFSIPPTPFIKQMNRATAGSAKESATEEGLVPLQLWLKGLVDDILEREFDAPDLEFKWRDDKEADPNIQKDILTAYVKSGVLTINESREILGVEPSDEESADTLMVSTANGYVPLSAGTAAEARVAASHDQSQSQSADNHTQAMNPPAEDGSEASNAPPGGKGSGQGKKTDANGKPVKPAPGDKGVGKLADLPFAKAAKVRRIKALTCDSPTIEAATAKMAKLLTARLKAIGGDVAGQVKRLLRKLGKLPDDPAHPGDHTENVAAEADMTWGRIVNDIDLSGINSIADDTAALVEQIASEAVHGYLAQVGVTTESDLVNQINERAIEWAKERSAELVSFSADAEYSLVSSTREAIRQVVVDGLTENIGMDEIAANLEASFGFSADRADLIARTEISTANSMGSLIGARGARDDLGLSTKKAWSTAGDDKVDEDICQANEDEGPIQLDQDFQSGDESTPGHPNCRCAMVYEVDETSQDSVDGTDE
jgi:hypothetical protein